MNLTQFRVAVLKGGFSKERQVSLATGAAAAAALREAGCRVAEVDVRSRRWRLPADTEVVFVALHGTYGEDGELQERLERQGVPFTGSSAEACRRSFNKAVAKECFRAAGLATPQDLVLRTRKDLARVPELPFALPVVVKPAREGSSIGVRIVRKRSELAEAIRQARRSDEIVLVEKYVPGLELTVGVLGNRALPPIEIRPRAGWYDYRHKYTAGNTEYLVPATIAERVKRQLQRCALAAHRALGCRDMSRADFRLDVSGGIYLLEVNTIPGMTTTSLLPKAAAAAGITFPRLCLALVKSALQRGRRAS